MASHDKSSAEVSLRRAWFALTGRLAAAVGACAALLSLLYDVPLGVACLRGGGAFLAVSLVARVGWAALGRAVAGDAGRGAGESSEP